MLTTALEKSFRELTLVDSNDRDKQIEGERLLVHEVCITALEVIRGLSPWRDVTETPSAIDNR